MTEGPAAGRSVEGGDPPCWAHLLDEDGLDDDDASPTCATTDDGPGSPHARGAD